MRDVNGRTRKKEEEEEECYEKQEEMMTDYALTWEILRSKMRAAKHSSQRWITPLSSRMGHLMRSSVGSLTR